MLIELKILYSSHNKILKVTMILFLLTSYLVKVRLNNPILTQKNNKLNNQKRIKTLLNPQTEIENPVNNNKKVKHN